MKDIHGIRPPVQVGFDMELLKIPLIVLGVIILLLLLFFLIRKWWKKRKQPKDLNYLPKPLAPYDAALRQLDLLLRKNMEPRIFYFDLTAILRKYIGGRFSFNAIEMTSQEFVKSINLIKLDKNLKKELIGFQKISDPFKYAGHVPEAIKVQEDLVFVKKIIDQIEKDRVEKDRVENDRIKANQAQSDSGQVRAGQAQPKGEIR